MQNVNGFLLVQVAGCSKWPLVTYFRQVSLSTWRFNPTSFQSRHFHSFSSLTTCKMLMNFSWFKLLSAQSDPLDHLDPERDLSGPTGPPNWTLLDHLDPNVTSLNLQDLNFDPVGSPGPECDHFWTSRPPNWTPLDHLDPNVTSLDLQDHPAIHRPRYLPPLA